MAGKPSNKIILDLCGGTGAWSRPYAEAGYDVRNITLPDYDVLTYEPPANVYGILAAPPCTEFSLAKGNRPRDLKKGMMIVAACLRIIWTAQYANKLQFWSLENPVGLLRRFLGKPRYTFEQWQFGTLTIKKTDLFGCFNTPKPTVIDRPDKEKVIKYPNGKSNARCWPKPECQTEYKHLKLNRQALRAITPPGLAGAFFEANK